MANNEVLNELGCLADYLDHQNIHAGPIRLWRRIMANNEVLYELGCLADYLNHHTISEYQMLKSYTVADG